MVREELLELIKIQGGFYKFRISIPEVLDSVRNRLSQTKFKASGGSKFNIAYHLPEPFLRIAVTGAMNYRK